MKKYLFIFAILSFLFTSCVTRVVTPSPHSKVVVIKTPPKNHKVVVIKGKRYYQWDGRNHRKTRRGYVVVKH